MAINYPLGQKDADEVIDENDLYARAGLVYVGVDEDNIPQYQGTAKQWEEFEKLSNEE